MKGGVRVGDTIKIKFNKKERELLSGSTDKDIQGYYEKGAKIVVSEYPVKAGESK